MNAPVRIIAPVALAAICSAGLVAFLWLQLTQSTKLLQQASSQRANAPTEKVANPMVTANFSYHDEALTYLRQGDILALRAEWEAATTEYQKAVEAGGGLPALRKLAGAQLQLRDSSGVDATIRQLKRAGAKPADLLLLESIVNLRSGELVKARKVLEDAEDSPQKHYAMALLSIVEGNHEQAQLSLEAVIGGWEPQLRSNARSITAAYEEFKLFPESSNIHLITLLSRALAQVQECEIALPLLVQVTQAKDNYRDAWIVQGYCELTTGRGEQALASLEQAYNLDPQKPEIQYFLARSYASLNDYQNAITFFEYALQNGFQPSSEVRRHIAEAALSNGNGDLALEQYSALTSTADATLEHFEGHVTTSVALGKSSEAYLLAQQAVERWPNDAVAHYLLGWTALETDKPEEATASLKQALDINPFLEAAKQKLGEL